MENFSFMFLNQELEFHWGTKRKNPEKWYFVPKVSLEPKSLRVYFILAGTLSYAPQS
jgi:hypothetical protein